MTRVERFVAAGRALEKGSLVRIQGQGSRIYKVRHLANNDGREWLEVYGPVDRYGVAKPKACYRSFPTDAIRAKVRPA